MASTLRSWASVALQSKSSTTCMVCSPVLNWRRVRDSKPSCTFEQCRFQNGWYEPLTQLSALSSKITERGNAVCDAGHRTFLTCYAVSSTWQIINLEDFTTTTASALYVTIVVVSTIRTASALSVAAVVVTTIRTARAQSASTEEGHTIPIARAPFAKKVVDAHLRNNNS